MLKMKCLEVCKQVIQGKDFYRSLFLVDCGDGTTQLIERYLSKKPEINKVYDVIVGRTSDLKYLTVTPNM